MDTLQKIKQPITEELERYEKMFRETMTSDNPLLNIALQHLTSRKGKQMRPVMLILSAKGLKSEVSDEVLHAAVALELLHTASLVHDDVVDESDRRRGQKSINNLLDNKAAVLVGDFILSKALEHAAATLDVAVFQKVALLGQTLADGELLQLNNTSLNDFAESAYYDVIRKKTASLFTTCAEVGAMLSGGDEGYCYVMKRFGMLTGMCFQLRDDIFDIDQVEDIGKPVGNDLKEGKLTLPVLFTCNKNKEAASLGLKVRAGEASEDEIARLVKLTHQEGGIIYAEKAMDDFTGMASGLLDDMPNDVIAEALSLYLHFVSRRKM